MPAPPAMYRMDTIIRILTHHENSRYKEDLPESFRFRYFI